MRMLVGEHEANLLTMVGAQMFMAARRCLTRGELTGVVVAPDRRSAEAEVRSTGGPYLVAVKIWWDDAGRIGEIEAWCDCPDRDCPHAVALALRTLGPEPEHRRTAPWEHALAGLLAPEPAHKLAVGLQFDLHEHDRGARPTLEVRPVKLNAKGRWVRQGISWSTLGYGGWELQALAPEHLRLLKELLAAAAGTDHGYGYSSSPALPLTEIRSRRVWDLLAEAVEVGLTLTQSGAHPGPTVLHTEPAAAGSELREGGRGLELSATVDHDGTRLDPDRLLLVGQPAHGVAWWRTEPDGRTALHLARLGTPATGVADVLLRSGTLPVPREDEGRFVAEYLPALRRQVDLRADDSLDLPEPGPPVLRVTVARTAHDRISAAGSWRYRLGNGDREAQLTDPVLPWRDPDGEREVLGRVRAAGLPVDLVPRGLDLTGVAAARFVAESVPVLRELDDVEVVLDARTDEAGYREVTVAPVVTVKDDGSGADRDWFDLELAVSIDGEAVPFTELFLALAREEPYLLLPSGAYFRLDREEFDRLARLIAEARALDDVERDPDRVRLSRFQAGLWEELEELGVVDGEAAAWQESIRALREAPAVVPVPAPSGLRAELRPYQLAGFNWLAALHRFRLGGILADDMGLGKTVQTLALVQHVREQDPSGAPFLVVAPTSVVGTWATEAARFTPDLPVAVITGTARRRGRPLAEAVAGAALVVTSYTLLRLESEEYEALPWAGLVLDEAQMVKNHQARGYAAVRRVPAPFKLAITGTPMENTLMELWALLSITAPGLFSSPSRFTDHYRNPIEKAKDADRLAQLRSRIRPLMLRRTKGEVLPDLPAKQEQVRVVELNPQHRKAYQLLLNRERQKVLGLLDDLDGNRFEILRSLTLLRQAALDLRLVDEGSAVPSSKLDDLMEVITEAATEGHRTLVFSQFTRFLRSAQERLEAAGLSCTYLDGRTTNRPEVIERFKTGTDPVFLISLKAGGFGLNLTEADYCILLDPWWNPATEAQAVDRVHRIGQQNPVMVYRLVARGTIEEKVMALKAEKAALFGSVMDGGDFASSSLSADDIRGLLE